MLAKFGVPPHRIVDYLTLMGDTVDNVPGVTGVGPKTAAKWIAEYGSLDGVIAAAPDHQGQGRREPARRAGLAADGPQAGHGEGGLRAGRACRLAGPALDELAFREPGQGASWPSFTQRNGFKAWLEELTGEAPAAEGQGPGPVTSAATPGLFDEPEPPAGASDRCGPPVRHHPDLRAVGRLDRPPARRAACARWTPRPIRWIRWPHSIVGISFADKPGEAAYIPLAPQRP